MSLQTFALFIAFASLASSQKHHKVRHKHNLLSLRDNHVNEIREAFDEYRHLLHKKDKLKKFPEVNLSDDEYVDNNLNLSEEHLRTTEKPRKKVPEIFYRNKRVEATRRATTTAQSSADDDEYFDDDNDTTNRRLNDDAQVRFSRDVS